MLLYLTGSQHRKQEKKKGKREGERKLCDGELTAEYRPDLEEKAPSVHGLG